MKSSAEFWGKQLPFKAIKRSRKINPHVLLETEATKLACNVGSWFIEMEKYTLVVNSWPLPLLFSAVLPLVCDEQ